MSQNRPNALAIVALAVLVVVAGCSGAGGGGAAVQGDGATASMDAESAEAGGGDGGEPAEADAAAGGGSDDVPQVQDRQVIRTGSVVLTVEDFDGTKRELTEAVESRDGYVSDSGRERRQAGDGSYVVGTVTYRVPAERFDGTMERIEAAGTVERSTTGTRDVTDQLVDIEARLENLRAERDRLRELYDQANTTEDVLAVQRELSDVQGEIERLEARQQSLENQVAYSTLTVRLEEPRPTPDRVAPDRWYDTPVLSAFMQSVDGVVVVARAFVVGFAFALPYLLAFGLPVVVAGAVLWRLGRRYRQRS
jgi:hypothetical protein